MPVIVYKEPKVVYYAIEKCVITRLIGYFGTTYYQKGNAIRDKAEQIFYPAIDHFNSDIQISEVKKKYPEYFVFAFVRNPFDRVVSNYHFNRGPWSRRVDHVPTFTEYCLNMNDWNELKPLTYHLDIDIDFVGKFENFKEDFDKLHDILNIQVQYSESDDYFSTWLHPLGRKVNSSNRDRNYRIYYDKVSRREIAKRFKEDFKRFNYRF